MLRKIIYKTFGIRDGEIYISFLMQLYIFMIITVLLIVKPTVNALFLSQLGASQLPYGYLLVAVVAVITSYFYNKAIRRFLLLNVTIISLIFFSLFFISLSLILQYGTLSGSLLYVYYLGVSLFAVVATSQFWILANMVFNTREGKRLFGFIGAGAIAGGIFGGYLTSIIASSFGNKVVILVAAVIIASCVPIIKKIWNLRINKMNVYLRNQRKIESTSAEESSVKIIYKSKHLTYLALITGIGVIVAKLVDFQFSDFANKAIGDPDELASFFGFWFSSFNVLAFCLQLFVTNRVLNRLGVASTLLVLPLAIALGSLLFLTFPALWVLIIIKGVDIGFKQSLNKAAVELSIMPIPLHIKNQAKSYIDVAVDSIATGIAGFMLIFLVRKLDLDTIYITVIIIFFVLIWLVFIYKLREAYFDSFRENIQRTLEETKNNLTETKNETTISAARRIINEGNEGEILALLDRLSQYKLKTLTYNIIGLLEHPSDKVKIEAIKQLDVYDNVPAIDKVEPLVYKNNPALTFVALDYIFSNSAVRTDNFFNTYLNHEALQISNAALLILAKEVVNNQKLASRYELYKRLDNRIHHLNSSGDLSSEIEVSTLLQIVAYSNAVKYFPFITIHLNNKNPNIVKQAIKAAGITTNGQFIEPLMEFLTQKEFRNPAIKSLKKFGPVLLATIIKLDKNQDLEANTKKYLPRVIQSFKTQKAVVVLLNLLQSKDVQIRLETTKSLLKLKRKGLALNFNTRILRQRILVECRYYKRTLDAIATFTKLINDDIETSKGYDNTEILITRESILKLLNEQLDDSFKSIFNLLSLVYNEADIEMTFSGLLSDIKDARLNALEFLDNFLQSKVRTSVLPLVEHTIIEDDNSKSSILHLKVLTEKKSLVKMTKNRGKKMKLEILNLIHHLNDPQYLSLVNRLKKHRSKEVKYHADKTYAKLRGF